MKYICITEIDCQTKVLCTVAPQQTGPSLPALKGLILDWANYSAWPIKVNSSGIYLNAPRYYGTCDDDADLSVNGVLEVLTEQEWMQRKHDEFYARRPYQSWIWNAETFVWSSPIPYPPNAEEWEYRWDEETTSWTKNKRA